MKKMRKILCVALAVILAAGLLSGCESEEKKIENLMGTWTMVTSAEEDMARDLLENIDFYEEEIALVDLNSLNLSMYYEFRYSTYRIAIDAQATKECTREYYMGVFDALYEGRATLNETYGESFEQMTKGEFQQFYAELYEQANYTDMIDLLTENAYDYTALGEDVETGTYSIKGNQILCTITGQTKEESMRYKIEGDTLTLTYVDGVEVYTRSR